MRKWSFQRGLRLWRCLETAWARALLKECIAMPVVRLYANLRKLAGTKELSVTGVTLSEALNDLVRQHSPLREALLENDSLRPHVIVTVNGQNLVSLETPLAEQDVIAIFPP